MVQQQGARRWDRSPLQGQIPPRSFLFSCLFPTFLFPQEQDIPACPGAVQKQRSLASPWGATQPLGRLGDGDSTARSHSSPKVQSCSPGPYNPKEGRDKGPMGFSWCLPAGTILLCSPQKLPLKGPFSPSRVKPTQTACARSPMHRRSFATHLGLPETDLCPPTPPSCTGPCLRGGGSSSLESRP